MPNNWKTYKLDEISINVAYGYTTSASIENVGPKFLRITDIQDNYISWEKVPFCKIKENDLKKNKLEIGDIVVARTGNSTGATACIKDEIIAVFASYLIRFRIDKEIANPFYIDFILRSQNWKNYVEAVKGGSAQPGANAKQFGAFELLLPPLQEQQSIASILSAIDDKIENNLAINKTLEEMAMALYKHWFVDFGPFKDGEFVESELGMIPKGWEVKKLEELVDVGSSKRIFYNEYVEEGIPFYRGKEVIELSKGKSISSELFISNEKFEEIKSKFEVPKKGDILISSVGTIGVSWLVDGFENFYFKDGNLTWLKNYKTILKGEYLHLWLNSENGKNQIDGEVIGSTQKALTISSLRNFKILFPSENVYEKVGDEFVKYYDQKQLNLIEIKTLTQLRDTLLPKLISGEVRLKEFRE